MPFFGEKKRASFFILLTRTPFTFATANEKISPQTTTARVNYVVTMQAIRSMIYGNDFDLYSPNCR